jgi:hypothetical protein
MINHTRLGPAATAAGADLKVAVVCGFPRNYSGAPVHLERQRVEKWLNGSS